MIAPKNALVAGWELKRGLAALGRLSLHVGTKDGVNPRLITALLPEPLEQVSIETHGHDCFSGRQNNLRVFPEGFVGGAGVGVRRKALTNCCGGQAPKSFPVSCGVRLRGFASKHAFRAAPNAMLR